MKLSNRSKQTPRFPKHSISSSPTLESSTESRLKISLALKESSINSMSTRLVHSVSPRELKEDSKLVRNSMSSLQEWDPSLTTAPVACMATECRKLRWTQQLHRSNMTSRKSMFPLESFTRDTSELVSDIHWYPKLTVSQDMTGNNGLINADESAENIIKRIDELNIEKTGTFWHMNGEVLPW